MIQVFRKLLMTLKFFLENQMSNIILITKKHFEQLYMCNRHSILFVDILAIICLILRRSQVILQFKELNFQQS